MTTGTIIASNTKNHKVIHKIMNPKQSGIGDIQYTANLFLQIMLQLNVYVSSIWALLYAFQILCNISDFQNFLGTFVIIGFILAVATECWRLYIGYSGNLRAKSGDLSTFLIISPLIQLPILLFLLLSARTQIILIRTTTSMILVLIFIEYIIGIWTWRKLTIHHAQLYRLKRQFSIQKSNEQIIVK